MCVSGRQCSVDVAVAVPPRSHLFRIWSVQECFASRKNHVGFKHISPHISHPLTPIKSSFLVPKNANFGTSWISLFDLLWLSLWIRYDHVDLWGTGGNKQRQLQLPRRAICYGLSWAFVWSMLYSTDSSTVNKKTTFDPPKLCLQLAEPLSVQRYLSQRGPALPLRWSPIISQNVSSELRP